MKVVETEKMRALDAAYIKRQGSGFDLMERAGLGVAACVARLAGSMPYGGRTPVTLIAGKGNNGGDAFVAARVLAAQGFSVRVIRTHRQSDPRSDADAALAALRRAGIKAEVRDREKLWVQDAGVGLPAGGILVDAILGTGALGPARGIAAAAIEWMHRLSDRMRVVSVDMPSGVNADAGGAEGAAVFADITVCLGLPKAGLMASASLPYRGRVEVVEIGLDTLEIGVGDGQVEMVTRSDVAAWLPKRDRGAHKGSFGHLLVVGGSHGCCGAPGLSARAACMSGAGLVSAAVPTGIHAIVASYAPEVMVYPLPANAAGGLGGESFSAWRRAVEDFDAIVVGPGMMASNATKVAVSHVLRRASGPVVLDADALNVFADDVEALRDGGAEKVLTPHPGEASRLLGISVAEVQADREHALRELVDLTGATVVLKGAGTLVGAPDAPVWACLGGNPGMGSGGTGDVLAGVIGALLAQGLTPLSASAAAVWLHATAGDSAAWRLGEVSMRASDVIDSLSQAFRIVCVR